MVFEGLLEKLLFSYVGKFLSGMDKQNLKIAIWSGEVLVENVFLNPALFTDLLSGFPASLITSHIGKLHLKVPWSSLGSKPVEVTVEQVYLLMEETPQAEWRMGQSYNVTQERFLELHKSYLLMVERLIEKMKETKGKQQEGKEGFMGTMVTRIIDNLNIKIKNVHLRLESPLGAIGVTIDSTRVYTTNTEWEKTFVDTTSEKLGTLPIHKLMTLEHLKLYLNTPNNTEIKKATYNPKEKSFNRKEFCKQMKQLVYDEETRDTALIKQMKYILEITAEAKLIQFKRNKENIAKENPLHRLSIDLGEIGVTLREKDVQTIMSMLDTFKKFQMETRRVLLAMKYKVFRPFVRVRDDKSHKNIKAWWQFGYKCLLNDYRAHKGWLNQFTFDASRKKKCEEIFMKKFTKLQRIIEKVSSEQNGTPVQVNDPLSLLTPKSSDQLQTVILCTPIDILKDWVGKIVVKMQSSRAIIKELEEKQKAKKGKWPGFFSSKDGTQEPEEVPVVSEDERMKIETEINEYFKTEDMKELQIQLPQKYCWFILNGVILSLQINLVHSNQQGLSETIVSRHLGIHVKMQMYKKTRMLEVRLAENNVELHVEVSKNNRVITPIVYKRNKLEKTSDVLVFNYVFEPFDKAGCTQDISVKLEEQVVFYNTKVRFILTKLVQFKPQQSGAIGTVGHLQENTQRKLREMMALSFNDAIRLDVRAPVFILPFVQGKTDDCPAWAFDFGHLTFVNTENSSPQALTHYDHYICLIKNINFVYTNSYINYLDPATEKEPMLEMDPNMSGSGTNRIYQKPMRQERERDSSFGFRDSIKGPRETMQTQTTSNGLGKNIPGAMEDEPVLKDQQVLPDLDLVINVSIMKRNFYELFLEDSRYLVNAEINTIEVNLTKPLYENLMKLTDLLNSSESKKIVVEEKKLIIKAMKKIGVVHRKRKFLQTWEKFYTILTGNTLYFFAQKDDPTYHSYIWLRGSNLVMLDETEVGVPFGFRIYSPSTEFDFYVENNDHLTKWTTSIGQVINELNMIDLLTETSYSGSKEAAGDSGVNLQEQQKATGNEKRRVKMLEMKFDLKRTVLSLQMDDNTLSEKAILSTSLISLSAKVQGKETQLKFSAATLDLSYDLGGFNSGKLSYIITSSQTDNLFNKSKFSSPFDSRDEETPWISVVIIQNKDPESTTKLDVEMKLGSVSVVFDPLQVTNVLMFVDFIDSKEKTVRKMIIASNRPQPSSPLPQSRKPPIPDRNTLRKPSKDNNSDEREKKLTTEKVIQSLDKAKHLLRFRLSLEKVKVAAVHQKSKVFIASIHLEKSNFLLNQTALFLGLEGTTENARLFDMTNYPLTINSAHERENITPYEMVGINKSAQNHSSLISFNFKDFNQKLVRPEPEGNLSSICVSVNNAYLKYMQQPVMRLIDFIQSQIVEMFLPSVTSLKYENVSPKEVLRICLSILQGTLWCKVKVEVKQPMVILEAMPNSSVWIELLASHASVENFRMKSSDRIVLNRTNEYAKQFSGFEIAELGIETFFITIFDISITLREEKYERIDSGLEVPISQVSKNSKSEEDPIKPPRSFSPNDERSDSPETKSRAGYSLIENPQETSSFVSAASSILPSERNTRIFEELPCESAPRRNDTELFSRKTDNDFSPRKTELDFSPKKQTINYQGFDSKTIFPVIQEEPELHVRQKFCGRYLTSKSGELDILDVPEDEKIDKPKARGATMIKESIVHEEEKDSLPFVSARETASKQHQPKQMNKKRKFLVFQPLAKNIQMNLKLERTLNRDEMLYLYNALHDPSDFCKPKSKETVEHPPEDSYLLYNGNLKLFFHFSPINLAMSNIEYNHILKINFHNLSYDDMHDELLFPPMLPEEKTKGNAFEIFIDFEDIGIICLHDSPEELNKKLIILRKTTIHPQNEALSPKENFGFPKSRMAVGGFSEKVEEIEEIDQNKLTESEVAGKKKGQEASNRPSLFDPGDEDLDFSPTGALLTSEIVKCLRQEEREPFARIKTHHMRLTVERRTNREVDCRIEMESIHGSSFLITHDPEAEKNGAEPQIKLEEVGFLNILDFYSSKKLKSVANFISDFVSSSHATEAFEKCSPSSRQVGFDLFDHRNCQLSILVEIQPSPRKKEVLIKLNQPKAAIFIDIVMLLRDVSAVLSTSYPDALDRINNQALKDSIPPENPLAVDFEIQSGNICLTSRTMKEAIILRGLLGFRLRTEQEKSLEMIMSILGQEGVNLKRGCETNYFPMTFSFYCQELELFVSSFKDFIRDDLRTVNMRKIVKPSDFIVEYKKKIILTEINNSLFKHYKNMWVVNGREIAVRLAFTEITLIARIIALQEKLMGDYTKKTENYIKRRPQPPVLDVSKTTESTKYQIDLNSINIVMINNKGDLFSPLIKFIVTDTIIAFESWNKMRKLFVSFYPSASYFYLSISKWEHFLEKTRVHANYVENEVTVGDKKELSKFLTINLKDERFPVMNINLSLPLIKVLHTLNETWVETGALKRVEDNSLAQAQVVRFTSLQQVYSDMGSSSKSIHEIEMLMSNDDPSQLRKRSFQRKTSISNPIESKAICVSDQIIADSPYRIVNDTGYTLLVENELESIKEVNAQGALKKYILENGKQENYSLGDGFSRAAFNDTEQSDFERIRVKLIDFQPPIPPINGIEIERIIHETRQLTKNSVLFIESVIDENRKTIFFSSGISFYNAMDCPVGITLKAGTGFKPEDEEKLEPGASMTVPIDFQKGFFKFRLESCPYVHEWLPIESFYARTYLSTDTYEFFEYSGFRSDSVVTSKKPPEPPIDKRPAKRSKTAAPMKTEDEETIKSITIQKEKGPKFTDSSPSSDQLDPKQLSEGGRKRRSKKGMDDLHQYHEINTKRYARIKMRKPFEMSFRRIISFECPIIIQNQTPFRVSYKIGGNGISTKEGSLSASKKVMEREICISQASNIGLKLIVPGFKWSNVISLLEWTKTKYITIILKDSQDNEGYVHGAYDELEHKFVLYCKVLIKNESPCDLSIYKYSFETKMYQFIAGQTQTNEEKRDRASNKFVIIPHRESHLALRFSDQWVNEHAPGFDSCFSKQFTPSFQKAAQTGIPLKGRQTTLQYDFTITKEEKTVYRAKKLSTIVLKINPRFILQNCTKIKFNVMQTTTKILTINSKQRLPLLWPNAKDKRHILFQPVVPKGRKAWDWSSEVDALHIGVTSLLITEKGNCKKAIHLAIDKRVDEGLVFISIRKLKPNTFIYRLVNEYSDLQIKYRQVDDTKNDFCLLPKSSSGFSWTKPLGTREIDVTILPNDNDYEPQSLKLNFLQLNVKFVVELLATRSSNKENKTIYVKCLIDENGSRVLKFTPKLDFEESAVSANGESLNISMQIGCVGVSLLGELTRRHEIGYLSIEDIQVDALHAKRNTSYEVTIQNIVLNNNLDIVSSYPVALTTEMLDSRGKNQNAVELRFVLAKHSRPNLFVFNEFFVNIQPITARLDEQFLRALQSTVESFITAKNFSDQKIKKQEEKMMIGNNNKSWFARKPSISYTIVYIGVLYISSISLTLSFTKRLKVEGSEPPETIAQNTINAAEAAFLNFENTLIEFHPVRLESIFEYDHSIQSKILGVYSQQLKKNIIRLLASLSVIGNPLSVGRNVAQAWRNLKRETEEGFERNAFDGTIGFCMGMSELFQSTFSGFFGIINDISASLSNSAAYLSMDDDFRRKRDEIRLTKASSFFHGVEQGFTALGTGFSDGITGVVRAPFEEFKSNGPSGITQGVLKGLAGMAMKPFSGILDSFSKTAEGFQCLTTKDPPEQLVQRRRPVRCLFGRFRHIKEYNIIDSYISEHLTVDPLPGLKNSMGPEIFIEEILYDLVMEPWGNVVLVWTHKGIVIFGPKNNYGDIAFRAVNSQIRSFIFKKKKVIITKERDGNLKQYVLGFRDSEAEGTREKLRALVNSKFHYINNERLK